MRLLKRDPDEIHADGPETSEAEVVEQRQEPAGEPAERTTGRPAPGRWRRRTVTVPVTVPERAVRRTMTVPSRSVEKTSTWSNVGLAAFVAIAAGAALSVVGLVALVRAGVDRTWFRPRVEVLDADHTALLGVLEIGAGILLLLVGLLRSRFLVAIVGLAMAMVATAAAIEPGELQRELAIERWWAWVLAAVGVVLTLSALHVPHERRETLVDVP